MYSQLRARCEELRLDWSTLSLENLRKEKQALRSQISEKQRHCLELQVGYWDDASDPIFTLRRAPVRMDNRGVHVLGPPRATYPAGQSLGCSVTPLLPCRSASWSWRRPSASRSSCS